VLDGGGALGAFVSLIGSSPVVRSRGPLFGDTRYGQAVRSFT
jgi:hypothetical protein